MDQGPGGQPGWLPQYGGHGFSGGFDGSQDIDLLPSQDNGSFVDSGLPWGTTANAPQQQLVAQQLPYSSPSQGASPAFAQANGLIPQFGTGGQAGANAYYGNVSNNESPAVHEHSGWAPFGAFAMPPASLPQDAYQNYSQQPLS